MNKPLLTQSGAAILALFFAVASPVFAQAITKQNGVGTGKTAAAEQAAQPDQPSTAASGVPPRGTKVAPSTSPGQPPQPMTADTGVEPRGTKVAPSTGAEQGNAQKQ